MKKLLIRWAILVLSLILSAWLTGLVSTGFKIDFSILGILKLFGGVAVLSLLNATLGKLLKLLTIPLSCLTLGLFSLVINAAMFYAAGMLKLGFSVESFFPALIGSVLYSAASGILGAFVPDDEQN